MGSAEEACSEVHKLLGITPIFQEPKNVPFNNGLYFFYERGEFSPHGPEGRIVRIGNHPRSNDALVARLRHHYTGNKNSSVFRKLLGSALMRKADPANPCLSHWEKQDMLTCDRCRSVESDVSKLLRANFYFRCIEVNDIDSRNMLEKKLIATISLCRICIPSEQWLGIHTYSEKVRNSGLWNSNYVFDRSLVLQKKDLEMLEGLAIRSAKNLQR